MAVIGHKSWPSIDVSSIVVRIDCEVSGLPDLVMSLWLVIENENYLDFHKIISFVKTFKIVFIYNLFIFNRFLIKRQEIIVQYSYLKKNVCDNNNWAILRILYLYIFIL